MKTYKINSSKKSIIIKKLLSIIKKINFFLNLTSILLGSIAALVGTILNNHTTVYIFLVVAHWIITTFNTFSKVFRLKTKEHKHFNCLKQYKCLKQEVDLYILENQIIDNYTFKNL